MDTIRNMSLAIKDYNDTEIQIDVLLLFTDLRIMTLLLCLGIAYIYKNKTYKQKVFSIIIYTLFLFVIYVVLWGSLNLRYILKEETIK